MENPIGWFEIYVQDMSRARTFYERVLGHPLEPLSVGDDVQMFAFTSDMAKYGSGGALVCAPGMAVGSNSVLVYFQCNDCAQPAERAAQAGGEIVKAKFSIGDYGYVSLIRDTEGNLVGLHSQR